MLKEPFLFRKYSSQSTRGNKWIEEDTTRKHTQIYRYAISYSHANHLIICFSYLFNTVIVLYALEQTTVYKQIIYL